MSHSERVALVVVVMVALYALLMAALVRWSRNRLFVRAQRAAAALEARGAKVVGVQPSPGLFRPAEVAFELDGRRARFQVRRYGRDWIQLTVHVDAPPQVPLWIRAEGAVHRLGKALGLQTEVQLGDEAFDKAAFIASSAPDDVVKETLRSPEVRGAVLRVLGLGYDVVMSREGLAATRVQLALSDFDPAPVPDVMRALEGLLGVLPRVDPATLTYPTVSRVSVPVIAAILFTPIVAGVFGAALPSLHPPVDDANSLKAMALGLVPWALAVWGLSRALRRRPMALVEWALTSMFALVGVCALTAGALMAANSGLDRGAPVTHTTRVLRVARRDSEARVVPWDSTRTWQKVGMPRDVWRTLQQGDLIDVEVHPGALGWPWVSRVAKTP